MKKKRIEINLFTLSKLELIQKINRLNIKNMELEDSIKNELFKTFMEKLREPQEINRLKKENKNLRLKVKTLKQLIKE